MSEKHGSHWAEREDFGDVTVIRLKTPKLMDEDTIRTVFDPIATLTGLGRTRLVLNLESADYLPSMDLAKHVLLNRKAQAGDGRLALCQLSPIVREILETTHLIDLFGIYGA